jgi:hypothetical protein
MRNEKWLLLALLLAGLLLVAVACGGEKATTVPQAETTPLSGGEAPAAVQGTSPTSTSKPLPTSEPTAQAEPTAEPEAELSAADLVNAEDLDSYRSTTTIGYTGTKDGKPFEASTEVFTEYTREPAAQHISMTSTSSNQLTDTGTIEIYQVEGMQYMKMQDQWISTPVTDTSSLDSQGLISGENMLTDACGWKKQGTETIDGVRTEHWTLPNTGIDKCFASLKIYDEGELTGAGGDVYIAVDGKYVVKTVMYSEGKGLSVFGGETEDSIVDEGRMEITYTMSDVNEPFTIEVPEEALKGSQLPEDIPTPVGAQGVSQMFGMISFTSDMTAQEVADFYKAEMPNSGWSLTKDESFGDFYSLEFTKGGRTASFMITTDATSGKTSALITVQGE